MPKILDLQRGGGLLNISNATASDGGINNPAYYSNNNTLNILNSLTLSNNLPTIAKVTDLIIQSKTEETEGETPQNARYSIDGGENLGYILENSTLTINNLDFTNFSNPSQTSNESLISGTALTLNDEASSAVLNNVNFINNFISIKSGSIVKKSLYGGAISNNGTINANNSGFSDNYIEAINTSTAQGGAVYNKNKFTAENAAFENNRVTGENGNVQGGAISNAGGTTSLTGTQLNLNFAETTGTGNAQGGAVSNASGTTALTNSTLTENKASAAEGAAQGGAFYNSGTGKIEGGEVSQNTAVSTSGNAQGGAVYNTNSMTISGNTSVSGNSAESEASNASGGAIYNAGGTSTLTNVTLNGNKAGSQGKGNASGGAVHNANGTTNVQNSTISSNMASSVDGTAQGGAFYNSGTGKIEGGEIIQNSANSINGNAQGGAVYNTNSMTITGTELKENYVTSENSDIQGAAIYNAAGTTTITGSTLSGNYANANESNNAQGGAIYNEGTLNTTNSNFTDNNISSNTGNSAGGAIYNTNIATISGGEISGNKAVSVEGSALGGAIYNSGNLTINGTTISANSAQATGSETSSALGGAIYNEGTLNLANTTFKDNWTLGSAAGEALGSAIYTTTNVTLQGGNTFEAGNDIYFAAGADGTTGKLLVNGSVSDNADTISGSLITADGAESSIELSDGGKLILNGDNSKFNGNANIGADSTLTYGSEASMLDSTVVTGANGGVELNFTNDYTLKAGKITTQDGISGNFTKSGDNTLTLTGGDYSDFSGSVTVNSGTLSYIQEADTTKYFNATSNTINTGAVLNYQNDITEATIQGLNGSGTFNKTGSQNLTLDGNNSGFTGNLNLQTGTLDFTKNQSNSFIAGNINLNSGTTLNYTSTGTTNLGANSQFKFADGAAGATINFTNGTYNFASDLQNIANNSANFNSATLALSGTNYAGNYSITNSIIDMTDNKISDVSFSNLTLNGDNNLTIDFINGDVDTLSSTNTGSLILDVNDISFNLSEDNGELEGEYQVLGGNLTFANNGNTTISSAIYNYTVSYVQGGNTIKLTLDSLRDTTLYALNHEIEGDRTFKYAGSGTYYIGTGETTGEEFTGLGTTLTGTLNIEGIKDSDTDVISAKASAGASNGLTMFELTEEDTILNIKNITIRDAQSETEGAVIKATAADAVVNIENSVITENSSSRGGALYLGNPPPKETDEEEEPENPDTPEEPEPPVVQENPVINITGTTFSNNKATGTPEDADTEIIGNGGAIYLGASSPDVTISDTTFTGNTAANFGGAVYNASGGNILFENVTFQDNTAERGSAVYNLGTMELKNAAFSGNTEEYYIFNGRGKNLTLSADKDWKIDNGTGSYIYNAGTLNLEQAASDSQLTIADEIRYGIINTSGNITLNDRIYSLELKVNKDSVLTLESGDDDAILDSVVLSAVDSTINLKDSDIDNGSIRLDKNSVFNITTTKETKISSDILGDSDDIENNGTFNKDGSDKLILSGINNEDFNGTLNINEGVVEFDKMTSNTFFGGDSKINVATDTEFLYNSTDTKESFLTDSFSNITLLGGAKLSVQGNGAGSSKFTLENGWFSSEGASNTLLFSNADFILNGKFDRVDENPDDGVTPTLDNVIFDNAVVSAGEGLANGNNVDFGANNYTFTDSTLNFTNQTAGDTFTFDNLVFDGSGNELAIDVNLSGNGSSSDYFVYTNGSGKINLTGLYINADDSFKSATLQLFKKDSSSTSADNIEVSVASDGGALGWATNQYVYEISATDSTGNTTGIIDSITIDKGASSNADTLRDMNVFGGENGGERGFSFIASAPNGEEYHIGRDLGETSKGNFTVVGDEKSTGGKTILSGEITEVNTTTDDKKLIVNDTSATYDGIDISAHYTRNDDGSYTINLAEALGETNGSMFEIVNDTNFEMTHVSVEDAVRYETDAIKDGAAIYANESNSSTIILNNVDFKNNITEAGRGGAIANIQSGSMSIYHSVISGNSASGNGGAIYNTDTGLSILETTFDGNSSGDKGGAIYTDKNLLISDSSFGSTAVNTQANGELNDIYIDNEDATVTFVTNSGIESYINSGIAGTGNFIKTGAGNLNLTGVNKDFTGKFTIINGNMTYTADSADDSFLQSSSLEIATGSELKMIINEAAGPQYIQNVSGYSNSNNKTTSGTINISGGGELYLDGDNEGFSGRVTIEENTTLTYIANESGETYFGGPTTIKENAALYLDIEDGMPNQKAYAVSGEGLFDKSGGGNINLTGNNSEFTGTANINEGSVTYQATSNSSSYFNTATNIGEGATLIADINKRDSEGVLIDGQTIGNLINSGSGDIGGNFTKKGEGDLQLTGDNSGLTGTTTVEEGRLTFIDKDEVIDEETGEPTGEILEHSYTGGDTVIKNGAELEYTAVENAVINGLTGSGEDTDGTLTKLGAGDLQLDGDNSTFKGNIALEEGSLTYDSVTGGGEGFLNNINSIEFGDDTALNIINNENDDASIKEITGSETTQINKDGKGQLTLTGDNSEFLGDLTITTGNVSFTKTDDDSYIAGNTIIEKDGSLDYTSDSDDTLEKVSGSGTLNKSGSGTLTFNKSSNNVTSDFTANINAGTLKTQGSSKTDFDYNINVNNDSTFDYTAATGANITLDGENSKLNFNDKANNANIIFNQGTYTLEGELANAIDNTITFNDATIKTGTSEYNANYVINGTTIDLTNDNDVATVVFNNINTDNGGNKLKIDVNLNIPGKSTADTLEINNDNGQTIDFALTEINLTGKYDDGLNGLNDETGRENKHVVENIVSGNATLSKDTSLQNWATDVYEYSVEIEDNNVILEAIKAADNNSLKTINQLATAADGSSLNETTRGFQFRNEGTYTIGSDLGETHSGTITIVGNNNNTVSGGGKYSFFEITKDNTDFEIRDLTISNANGDKGGSAILANADNSTITIDNVNFTNNTSTSGNGGAINNTKSNPPAPAEGEEPTSTVGFNISNGEMSGNKASAGVGGAIYTNDEMNITDINFSNNSDKNGKNDIYADSSAVVNLLSTDEINGMNISSGLAGNGTINKFGSGNLSLSGKNNLFSGNLNMTEGDLNYTQTDSGDSFIGGTTNLYDNALTLDISKSNTTAGNFTGDKDSTITKTGGYNLTISGDNSGFTGTTNIDEGGLVFTANSANDKFFGGDTNISEDGTLSVNANTNTTLSNLNNEGKININTGSTTYLEKIASSGTVTKDGRGSLVMTGDNKDFTGNLNINSGTFAMAAGAAIGDISYGSFAENTALNLQNSSKDNYSAKSLEDVYFEEINLDGIANFDLDVDLKNQIADKIGAGKVTGNGQFLIDQQSLNVISDTLLQNSKVEIAYGDITDNILLDGASLTVMGPIQKYTVAYEEELADPLNPNSINRGNLIFTRQGGGTPDIGQVNMSAMASSVASQVGGYLTQLDTLHAGFFHMDRYSKYPYMLRMAAEKSNVNAITETPAYNSSSLPETSSAMWVKPYTTFEQVSLKGGIDVSNVSYGAVYGGDTDLVDLGHGFKGVLSMFLGYNGAHMSYNGISMNQQGGALGATGTLYKGNFFTGLTVSTGASAGEAYTSFGTDNFSMLTAGIASKTGYNWEIKEGKLIVQPTLFLGYTFVNTFDYTNAAGVRMDSDPLHAIQIVPGVKLIGNLKNGWQPYLGVNMVWSIMDKTYVMANDVRLPQLSVKPYVEYGVGVQKSWGERFTAFFQTMLRNGGRTGVALTAGFRWAIGKSPENSAKNKPVKNKVIKSL